MAGTSVGDLFVSLGIKGNDKTIGALDKTKKGLLEIKDVSFEAKAAIIGAMYALERVFAKSGQAGTDLTNFSALMGGDMVQMLQRYQYAARQVGLSNEEVSGTFKTLQDDMAKIKLNQGIPSGMGLISKVVGISRADIQKFADHPEQLLQKLQEFAGHKEISADIANNAMKSLGISDGMIAALRRQAFRPDVLAKAPTYSNGETASLDKANIAWSNLGNTIEMAVGHFNAKHGGELVKGITEVVPQVIKLAEAFEKLATKFKLFDKLSLAFKGWALIFKTISENAAQIGTVFEGWQKIFDAILPVLEKIYAAGNGDKDAQKSLGDDTKGFFHDLPAMANELKKGWDAESEGFHATNDQGQITGDDVRGFLGSLLVPQKALAPSAPATGAGGSSAPTTHNIDIKQDFHVAGGGDPQVLARAVKKANSESYSKAIRQSAALTGGP